MSSTLYNLRRLPIILATPVQWLLVMPDLIGHPGLKELDSRLRGNDNGVVLDSLRSLPWFKNRFFGRFAPSE